MGSMILHTIREFNLYYNILMMQSEPCCMSHVEKIMTLHVDEMNHVTNDLVI